MKQTRIGLALTGSFCTMAEIFDALQKLVEEGYDVTPILSYHASALDTRFISAEELQARLFAITGKQALNSIVEVEPLGPKKLMDLVIVAPCTGNTLAKLAHGITDTPALMACKSHLRNQRPVLLGIATNDALSANAQNLGMLLNRKHIYFVPFGQDGIREKPTSMQSDFSLLSQAVTLALQGIQMQPLLLPGREG